MPLRHALRKTTETLDRLEESGFELTEVTARERDILVGDELQLVVTGQCHGLSEDHRLTSDIDFEQGCIQIDLAEGFTDIDAWASNVDISVSEMSLDADRGLSIKLELTVATDMSPTETEEDGVATERDQEAPHRDPERLQEVYETRDSFRAMTQALGVDVTPETVRQQMIKHGIHEVQSDLDEEESGSETDTDDEGDSSPEENGSIEDHPMLADGNGFHEDIQLSDVQAAVQNSRSVYEVQKQLNIDGDSTRRLLKELNLIDLVYGCVSNGGGEPASADEVDRRIAAYTK